MANEHCDARVSAVQTADATEARPAWLALSFRTEHQPPTAVDIAVSDGNETMHYRRRDLRYVAVDVPGEPETWYSNLLRITFVQPRPIDALWIASVRDSAGRSQACPLPPRPPSRRPAPPPVFADVDRVRS